MLCLVSGFIVMLCHIFHYYTEYRGVVTHGFAVVFVICEHYLFFSITAMHESAKIVWTGVKVHVIGKHTGLLLENLSCRTTKLSIERRYTECHIFIVMLVVVTSKLEPRNVL